MKRCSYCGAEYTDDAKICAIDETPLEGTQLETLPEFPQSAMTANWNKILSTMVAVVYVIYGLFNGGILGFIQTLGVSFVLLMIIWNADEIGSYTGGTFSGWITSPTPAWIVRIFGWIFLLAPGVFAIYSIVTHKH